MRSADALTALLTANVAWSGGLAEIVSFDSATQTAVIKPLLTLDGVQAPNVSDCPVMMLAGGDWSVNTQLAAGDFVAALFTAQPIKLWVNDKAEVSELQHAQISDAIVLPCITRKNAANTSGTSAGITLKNSAGTVQFKMSDAGIEVKGDVDMENNATVNGSLHVGLPIPIGINVGTHTHTAPAGGGLTSAPTPGS